MFGRSAADALDAQIAVHFSHRAGALVVALASSRPSGTSAPTIVERRELTRPASLLIALVACR